MNSTLRIIRINFGSETEFEFAFLVALDRRLSGGEVICNRRFRRVETNRTKFVRQHSGINVEKTGGSFTIELFTTTAVILPHHVFARSAGREGTPIDCLRRGTRRVRIFVLFERENLLAGAREKCEMFSAKRGRPKKKKRGPRTADNRKPKKVFESCELVRVNN